LLPGGAFLVECGSSGPGSDDRLTGRVEHIVSGRATSFESPSKLIDFMRGVLAPVEIDEGGGDVSPTGDELDGSDGE